METNEVIKKKKEKTSLEYYAVCKFTASSPISLPDAHHFLGQALKELGSGIEVDIVQVGELID